MQEQIGRYRIVGEIGRGGMGVVFRATDMQLGRDVAIKALPQELATDRARLDRFEREARTLAQVSHPNIAGIFGVEESQGRRYIVMELVDGETLADRLDRGPLEPEEAVEIACQIAAGVSAAHDAGIIHRDLKPANIRVSHGGVVKVLDFGLARLDEGRSSGSGAVAENAALESTIPGGSPSPTVEGVILGTAAYMSPEQARGRRVDRRTDVWSFGVVLYEMLVGASPFHGETMTDSIGAILHKDPDLARVPARLRPVLSRCLARDRDRRFRDLGDVALELRAAMAGELGAAGVGRGRVALVAGLVALCAAGAGLAAGWLAKPAPAPEPAHLSLVARPEMSFIAPPVALSGDRFILPVQRVDRKGTWWGEVRGLDSYAQREIPGLRGARGAAVSPDGAWFAFVAPQGDGGGTMQLMKYATGGDLPPQPVCQLPPSTAIVDYSGAWLDDQSMLFVDGNANLVRRVNLAAGTVDEPVAIDLGGEERKLHSILASVDRGRVLAATSRYTSTAFQYDIVLLDFAARRATTVVENSNVARLAPDGSLLFTRGSRLFGASFDHARGTVGPQVQLEADLRTPDAFLDARFSISRTGTLAYLPGGDQGTKRSLVIRGTDGSSRALAVEALPYCETVVVSPDESRLLVTSISSARLNEIWGTELESPRIRRVRADSSADFNYPVFLGDSDSFACARSLQKKNGIEIASFDGKFEPYWLVEPQDAMVWPSSVDLWRNRVLCVREERDGSRIYTVEVRKGAPLVPLFNDSAARYFPDFSPDGTMLAYLSNETGRLDAYVCAIEPDGRPGRAVPLMTGGARFVRWQPGKPGATGAAAVQRLHVSADTGVIAFDIAVDGRPRPSAPIPLAIDRTGNMGRAAPLSGDRRITIIAGDNEYPATSANVIVGWWEQARRALQGK
ncbi:MAG: protein kinase [Phycisphaerales bacterium]